MSDRLSEIEAELKKLRKARRKLLMERSQLIEERKSVRLPSTSEYWVDPIFSIIENHPGASRIRIEVLLDAEHDQPRITTQVLTNTLTTLRRRGWIENRGTRKHPKWFARGRLPRSEWYTRVSIPS